MKEKDTLVSAHTTPNLGAGQGVEMGVAVGEHLSQKLIYVKWASLQIISERILNTHKRLPIFYFPHI